MHSGQRKIYVTFSPFFSVKILVIHDRMLRGKFDTLQLLKPASLCGKIQDIGKRRSKMFFLILLKLMFDQRLIYGCYLIADSEFKNYGLRISLLIYEFKPPFPHRDINLPVFQINLVLVAPVFTSSKKSERVVYIFLCIKVTIM